MKRPTAGIYKVTNINSGVSKIDKTKDIESSREKFNRPNLIFEVLTTVCSKRGYSLHESLTSELEQQRYIHINDYVTSLGLAPEEQALLYKEELEYYWSTRKCV